MVIYLCYNNQALGCSQVGKAQDFDSCIPSVQVRPSQPNSTNPNPKPVGEGFGFVVYFGDLNLTSDKKNKK